MKAPICPKCRKGFKPRQHKHHVKVGSGFRAGRYHAKCCPLCPHRVGILWPGYDVQRAATETGHGRRKANVEKRYCNACDWTGLTRDTVHPKHNPEEKLCPKCNETTGTSYIGCMLRNKRALKAQVQKLKSAEGGYFVPPRYVAKLTPRISLRRTLTLGDVLESARIDVAKWPKWQRDGITRRAESQKPRSK